MPFIDRPSDRPALVAVVGPTATGKTRIAVELALRMDGELVNFDSRQAIAELTVGVAKPDPSELRGIICHGLDWRHLGQPYTVADFVDRAQQTLGAIAGRGRLPILVGGTGLYLRALLQGFDFGSVPPVHPVTQATVAGPARTGSLADRLAAELSWIDPARAARTDRHNPRRLVRALELARGGSQPRRADTPWPAVWVGRQLSAGALRERIERRCAELVGPDLLLELERLCAAGVDQGVLADAAIGYREALDWRARRCGREQAVARVTQRTWRYARGQRTWFRREPQVHWVGDDDADEATVLASAVDEVTRGLAGASPSRWG